VAKIFENNTLNWVGGIFVFVNALLSIYFLTGNFLLPLAVGGTVLSIVILLVLVAKKGSLAASERIPVLIISIFAISCIGYSIYIQSKQIEADKIKQLQEQIEAEKTKQLQEQVKADLDLQSQLVEEVKKHLQNPDTAQLTELILIGLSQP